MTIPKSPYLCVLGPVKLFGVSATPIKPVPKLLEMLLWLLENPGRSPNQMTKELFIAPGTQRSYLCQLRRCLGKTPGGQNYLGMAYSGQLRFNREIDSDYFQARRELVYPLSDCPDDNILSALQMVQGAVMEDIRPGQWPWAEGLRAELTAQLTKAALLLTKRMKLVTNNELALWAAVKGLMVSPAHVGLYREVIQLNHQLNPRKIPGTTAQLLQQVGVKWVGGTVNKDKAGSRTR